MDHIGINKIFSPLKFAPNKWITLEFIMSIVLSIVTEHFSKLSAFVVCFESKRISGIGHGLVGLGWDYGGNIETWIEQTKK